MNILDLQNSHQMQALVQTEIKSQPARASADSQAVGVAQEFESLMIEQMMKSMRSASDVLAEEGLLNSREQSFWQEWQDRQMAAEMTRSGGIGLADHLLEQMDRLRDFDA